MSCYDGKSAEELKELSNPRRRLYSSKFTDAIQYYTQAIQVEPTNHVFFSNRSASYGGLEQWPKAAEDAKECIRLDPTFVKGYYRLAAAQMALNDNDGAIATIRQGLAIDANNPQLSKQMRIAQQQKKVADAKSSSPQQAPPVPVGIASGSLDSATAKELQELQVQYAQTSREYNTVQANLLKTQRECKVAEITCQELQDVPDSAKCYRSIGKMFLRSTKQGVIDRLMESMDLANTNDTVVAKKLEYLDRQMASLRQNMEELVSRGAPSSAE